MRRSGKKILVILKTYHEADPEIPKHKRSVKTLLVLPPLHGDTVPQPLIFSIFSVDKVTSILIEGKAKYTKA